MRIVGGRAGYVCAWAVLLLLTNGCSSPSSTPPRHNVAIGSAPARHDVVVGLGMAGESPTANGAADAGVDCTETGTCAPATASCSDPPAADGTPCDDGNVCTQTDGCSGGVCTGTPVSCTASDACHLAGTCDPTAGCSNPAAPAGTSCGDHSNRCAGTFACDGAGSCVQGAPAAIDTSNPCLVGSCNPATGVAYVSAPEGTACGDNSNRCAGAFTCNADQTCVQGPPPTPTPPSRCFRTQCDPATGFGYIAIEGCDDSPLSSDNPFERHGSVMGVVQTPDGNAVGGFSLTVSDIPGGPRTDVSLSTGNDGSFRASLTTLPATEPPRTPPHHVLVRVESSKTVPVFRDAYLHAGQAVDLGTITAALRDSKVTTIGAEGGTASDSQGLVEVLIPPGALAKATPIVVTPHTTRAEVPLRLPDRTVTTYAMTLEPDGTHFGAPVTVRVANWRNLPTDSAIPVGYAETTNAVWRAMGDATWDGDHFAFQTAHFSTFDANWSDPFLVSLLSYGPGPDPTASQRACMGSSVGLANGTLRQSIALPAFQRAGQSYGVTLSYDSLLAGRPAPTAAAGTSNASPLGSYAVVPGSGMAATSRGGVVSLSCVARAQADAVVASSPNSCVGGLCGGALSTWMVAFCTSSQCGTTPTVQVSYLTKKQSWFGAQTNVSQTIPVPAGALDVELVPSGEIPLANNGSPPSAFFAQRHTELSNGSAGSCISGGGAPTFNVSGSGTSAIQTDQEAGPLISLDEDVFVHQTATSSSGAGWGIAEVDRLYASTASDIAVIVRGNGDRETFGPRARLTVLPGNVTSRHDHALARDPRTGEIFVAQPTGEIDTVDPTTGSFAAARTGLSFPSDPMTMAVTYVADVRHFVVGLHTEVDDISDATGALRVLMPRTAGPDELVHWIFEYGPAVAAQNDLAFYVAGDVKMPVVYRFRLSDAAPIAERLTLASGGDASIDPTAPMSRLTLGDPHGLAYVPGKGLYIADRQRDVVYLASEQMNGEVGGASPVRRAVGTGGARFIPPLGYRSPGPSLPVAQPFMLSATEDGSLWIAVPFGFAIYDTGTGDARYVFFDASVKNSEATYTLRSVSNPFTSVPIGPSSLLAIDASEFRIDVDLLSSELDPTRTIALSGAGATLTDTSQDTVERFDANGRMSSLAKRTGGAIWTATYVPSTDRVATLVDAAGGSTRFAYDGSGKLQTITDPAGRATRVVVDGSGNLTSITKPDGETVAFAYTGHQLTSKTSPVGDVTQYTYGQDGAIVATAKPAPGNRYAISSAYSHPAQRDAQGNTVHIGTYTDPRGVVHTITVDHHGQVASDSYTADGVNYVVATIKAPVLAALNEDPYFSARQNTRLERPAYTTVNGLAVGLETSYDSMGRPAFTNAGDPHAAPFIDQYLYDVNGRLSLVHTGPADDDFIYERDAAGNVTRVADSPPQAPASREMRFTWNGPNGQADTVTVHGVTTTRTFDSVTGNPSGGVDSLGRVSAFTFDPAGNALSAFDGQTTHTFAYDANNRLTSSIDADGNATTFGYGQASCGCSEEAHVTSIHTPDLAVGKAWALTYGPEGRLATSVDPDGRSEAYTYEPTGELQSMTDRLGHRTTVGHDQLGRVKSLVDALGRAHRQSYPVPTSTQYVGARLLTGSASTAVAGLDLTTPLLGGDYQIGGRAIDSYSLDGGPSRFGTRGQAQITFYRDATQQISYGRQFDDALRLTRRADRSGMPFAGDAIFDAPADPQTASLSGNYTQSVQMWTPLLPLPLLSGYGDNAGSTQAILTYNGEFDLTAAQGYGGTATGTGLVYDTYTRDAAGRVTQLAQSTFDGSALLPATVRAYTYAPTSDRYARITNPDGVHDFTYDARGLVHTEDIPGEGTYTFAYDAAGRSRSLTYPDGHARVQKYDPEGRLVSRCYTYSNGAATRCYTAAYDAAGNPTTMTDPEGADAIQYDPLDRITSVTRSVASQPDVVERYAYNAIGALITNAPETTGIALDDQRPRIGGSGANDKAASAMMNAVDGAPVAVDPAGRVTSLEGATLTFNRQNRLVSIAAATTTPRFIYDSSLRRVSGATGADAEYYVYEGENIIARLSPEGLIFDTYLYDGIDSPLRMMRGGQAYYYEVDLAGNVRRLRDGSGADLGGYRYTAFGQIEAADGGTPAASVDQALRWKGRWFVDSAGGLYDMRARWWSPRLGAFLSVDEFAFHDRNSTLWGWPGQNPLRWSDPTGHDAAGAAIGASIGGGAFGWLGGTLGAAGGFVIAIPTGETGGLVTIPAGAIGGFGAGASFGALAGGSIGNLIGDWISLQASSSEKSQVKYWADALGLTPQQIREVIHRLKKSADLGGAQDVDIDPKTGEVTHQGESIGNVQDEDCKK